MDVILNLLYYTVKMSTPLLLCIIGGVFVQKAGTLNFALEAAINTGAFSAIVFAILYQNIWIGMLFAIISCILLNGVFGFFVIKLKAHAVIVGLAINMLMAAIPPYILQTFFGSRGSIRAEGLVDVSKMALEVPILRDIPILSNIFNRQTPLTYISLFIIIVLTIVFYNTKFGIYTQVTGENQSAADAVGIKTKNIKWIALAISGVTCALAGINISVETVGMFNLNIASARGLIALAAINCGKREPVRSCLFGVLFGFSKALQMIMAQYIGSITAELFQIVPYVTIIIVFLVTEIPPARKNPMRIFQEG